MSATKPVLQAAIQQYAKQLRLPTLGDQFARLAEEAVKEKQSHLSYLETLLEESIRAFQEAAQVNPEVASQSPLRANRRTRAKAS